MRHDCYNAEKTKVSVIIPAYNHERYIGASIMSVLEQSFEDFDLIIINDGSTDKTEMEILKFDDRRINYIFQENRGAHNAINKGIAIARSEYISILNSDDIYSHDRLAKCLKLLEENKEYSVVITEVECITSDGKSVANKKTPQIKAWLNWYKDAMHLYENRDFLLSTFAKNILITTSNYFARKAVFKKTGGFKGLKYAHDWDMLLRLAHYYKIHLMRDVLLQYRIHESNTVLEANNETKVKFEVNWLIAENIRNLKREVDVFELMDSIKKNHYVSPELLTHLLMINDNSKTEELLDFRHPTTIKMMGLFK